MRALRPLRQRPRVESLEARILYSADPVLAAFDAMPGVPAVERRVIDAPAPQPRIAPATDTTAAEARHELVLVDLRVSNWQELVDDIRRARGNEAEIVMLDPTRDGIEQISERLAQEHGLDAVHVVSHGEAGVLQIGATQLDFDTLLANATAVARWRLALNNGADLMLYGCDLAASSDGRSLVDAMSRLTGADVAASVDVTGGTAAGGDWVLEYTTGSIQSEALANAPDLAAWDGSLGITSPGAETRANTATSGSQTTWPTRRQVAIDGAGNFVVIWNDGSADDIYARRYDSAGNPLTSAFRVNTNTSSQDERAVVAMNASGAFVVVWQSDTQDPGGNAGIYAQVYDASGAAVGGEFRVNQTTSDDQESPSVSMDAAGNFVVSWTSPGQDNGSTYGVYARRFGATGTALGNEFLVNTTTAGEQEASSVAVNAAGDFVVAWQSTSGQDGGGAGIYARHYNSAGVAQTGELLVNTSTSGDQLRPSAAITANGDFMVVWGGAGTGGSGSDAYGQRFNSAGAKLGGELRLNTTTSSDQDYPVVAADSNGNYLVTWESNGQDGGGWGVYGRLLSNSGSFLTNETLINTTTSGDQDYPSVAWNGTKAVFLWEGSGSGDSSGVYFRTFDVTVPGVTVSAISGNTTEAGITASFSVVLNSQPSADVTIAIASSDTTEGTVSTSSLTFTSANWNVAQVVTVTGADDAADDGDIAYSIVTGAAASSDAGYNGLVVADVAATNVDNDIAGVTVSAISGNTTEAAGTATFGVQLTSQPTADVTISIASNDTTEGTVSMSSLTFTAANWNAAQVITLTGVDDALDDGNIAYSIVIGAATSADAGYGGMAVNDVAVTNVDDDTAGVSVSAISGNTTEAGGTATFGVHLTSQPTANVTISIASSDTTEGTVSASSLTFTAANWNVAQVVTVTGVDDALDDGDIAYSIVTGTAASTDAGYNGMAVSDLAVTNVDNDSAGTTVTPISGNTTEAGGTATFSVQLTSQPTADVTISVTSSDATEGTVSTASLTFTAANWSVAQVVTVTGVDDALDDGDIGYTIVTGAAASVDAGYNGLAVNDVAVTNVDNDTASAIVSAISGPTTEAGGTATFSVVLASQPTADVTISIASSDTSEGTVSISSLTFTAANWNVAQVVTVTGVDDPANDGNAAYNIVTGAATSLDADYTGLAVADVAAVNVDDDTAGITVSSIVGTTAESGATATFGVVLNTQPSADVTIAVASGNTAEGTVSTSFLTFTATNWNVVQTVTVTGVDDVRDDGDVAYSIVTGAASSADLNYDGMAVADVAVTNVDNDTAGVSVSAISGSTTEAGGTAMFSVMLTSQPTADVTISIATDDAAEGTASTSSLTFTAATWNVAQVVTVMGVDDAVDDGDIAYSIVTAAAASADAGYNGLAVGDVTVTNVDNDSAGVTVSAISGPTTEAGGTATFSVVLASQPTADVTISIASGDATEGTPSTSSLTFTTANWNVAQVVAVTGVDDAVADGDIAYTLVTGNAASADASYNALAVDDVAVTNVDNDAAGVTVSAISGSTTEAGGTAIFGVALASQPTADVTISIASGDATEGAVSTGSLTFTAANWNVAQVVTVTGVDDAMDDGDMAYAIVTGAAISADAGYDGMAVNDVAVTNVDNDTASAIVSAISGPTTEAGGTATFSVVLASQPTADVTISIASGNAAEGTVSTSSLTFTAANWDVARVVTVTGIDDALDDGDIGYSIVTGAASSADAGYNGMAVNDVAVTNVDNDAAGVSVSPVSGNTTEAGGTAVFGVLLTSQPTADVTISIASSDTTEGSVSTASLTFTAANWNVAQQIVVTGSDDAVADGTIGYSVVTGAAASADVGYNGLAVADIALNNTDDDNAGITVSPISGNTSEAGAGATFIVVLNSQPTADVTISIASSNPAEGTVSTSSLTFIAANWNQAQVVTVTGVDDALDDGDVGYSILTGAAAGADAGYNGMAVGDVAVTNVDNDSAGVTVSAISGSTTEAGGTAIFSVTLTSQPTADVVISIASADTTEGTVSTSSLIFTAANWNVAQVVTVTGVDDALDDGHIGYSIITGAVAGADANYNGMAVTDVAVTNVDNDTAGVTVSPISGNTDEAGGIATFSVRLTSQPTADVMLSLASSNTAEGTMSAPSLTFTAANWNVAQVVTVTGVDDAVADGDVAYAVVTGAASADAGYDGMAVADVVVINVDNDTAGVTLTAISGNTTEAGGTATFGVVLTSQPTADVTISIASGNAVEGTVSTSSLTFTAANWNVAQVVTVTGVDDALDDGNVVCMVVTGVAASADANYNGMAVNDVAVTNVDNDTAGITVSPISGTTNEAGSTATFSVQLTSQPTANVMISIASGDTAEGVVSTGSLIFTAANWNVAQVVTVAGVDDAIVDGNVVYSVVTGAATSADMNYDGMNAADVAVTNADDEQAPALALPGSLQVDEDTSLRLGDAGVSVADVNADITRIDLAVAHGGLTVDLTGGASVIAASADNRSISLTGTQAQLVDALTRITYRGDADWFGADTLDISATDAGGLQASHRAAINVAPVNDVPVIASASHVDIPEGQVLVTQVTSTDVEGDTRHYAIVGGSDAAQFAIDNNSGELRLRNAPDAEAPIDSNHDNVYEVTVEVVDSQGGTARQNLDVTVRGVNEAPSVTVSSLSVPLDGVVTLNQHQIVAYDVDSPVATLTFSVSGVVNGHFELVTQPGTAIASFSESTLEAGLVGFVHDAGAPPPQFVIAVSDGQASSAPLLVQLAVSAGQPAPAPHVGTPSTSPPEHESTPTLAEGAEPTPVRSAAGTPSVSRIETPDLPRPTPQADESTGAEFGTRSTARAFVFPLPAAATRGDEADGIFWRGDDPRRTVMLALHDDDSREAKEPEAAGMPRLGLAPVPAQEDAIHLELGTVVLQTLGIALTAGSVWWALRAAGLVTALLASLPAWRQLDFLPVLAEEEDGDRPRWSPAEDAEAARDEAAVERDLFAEGALR